MGAFASPTSADRFVLTNGQKIEGEVTAEDDRALTIEIDTPQAGVGLTRRLDKAQVKTWYRPSREGASYVVIPVLGVIGRDMTATALRAGLDEARAMKPRYVVLAIDSPGGEIGEMNGMIDLLAEASKDLEIIAYVKSAFSAAAVITMTCERVT